MAEVFGNQLTSDSSTFIDHRKTTSGMSPATDEVDAVQIFKTIIRAAVEHLTEIVSHVKRRPVVNFIGLVPVIGGDDLLESDKSAFSSAAFASRCCEDPEIPMRIP